MNLVIEPETGKTVLYLIIGLIVFTILMFSWLLLRMNKLVKTYVGALPKIRQNFSKTLLLMVAIAIGVIYLLKLGLENNFGQLKNLLFLVFPYVAIIIFFVGSIYKYRAKGFKVSSLSTQFLERKKLFWGSQPFHWGLVVLFFGHLIAFLFPRAILAWNGEPVRLIILEVTGFVFGLSALIGLILLVRRRLNSKRVLMTTNTIDMLVYTTLIVQIVSGLGIAYFERWGSSWFAGTLTPYLKSLFVLNPEISAVSNMPWIVQIHVFSAFFIIAIIPFTRFMHFLVAPLDYMWRRTQVVTWNWSYYAIRTTKAYFFGRKPENN